MQNQEFKKLKKIESQRRQAQLMFENKIEKHKINLEIEKQKELIAQERSLNTIMLKEKFKKNCEIGENLQLQKIEEAKHVRKISKKNSKIKFRQEVDVVKRNMEKRDEIWKQH